MRKNDGAGLDPAKVTRSHPLTETNGINESSLSGPLLYVARLQSLIILSSSLSSSHTPHSLSVSHLTRSPNCATFTITSSIALSISCFSSVSFPAEFHKIILIKLDIIFEGTKNQTAFVYQGEKKNNNKTYPRNGTWLDYFLQMYSHSGVRYCSL